MRGGRWWGGWIVLAVWAGSVSGAEPELAAGTCGPAALGAPCSQEGPANLPLGDGRDWRIGNPVHRLTGEKFQRDVDLFALPGELGLEVVRHYRAFDPRDEGLGVGWRLSYDPRLYRVGDGWQITQVDGSLVGFAGPASPGASCVAHDPLHGELRPLAQGGQEWRWPGGRRLQFDIAGRLVQIVAASGARLRIERGRIPGRAEYGRILSVEDPQGRRLRLQYRHGRLQKIDTPGGTLRYWVTGDMAWLRGVGYPQGQARLYLQDRVGADATARLAGVALLHPRAGVQVLWRWQYNADGRVRQVTTPATATRSAQTLALSGDDKVDSVAGQRAGPQGGPAAERPVPDSTSMRRDAQGRVVQVGEGSEAVRFHWWRNTQRLAGMTRPSQVAGRQHRLTIDWQEIVGSDAESRVVPTRVQEAGWAVGEQGPEAVQRRWQLHWQQNDAGQPVLLGVKREGEAGHPTTGALPGWPGYGEQRDDLGRLEWWRSRATGTLQIERPAANQRRLQFANGDNWHETFNEVGRLTRLRREAANGHADQIDLRWFDARRLIIDHPNEQRRYRIASTPDQGSPEVSATGAETDANADADADAEANADARTRGDAHPSPANAAWHRLQVSRPAIGPMPAWRYEEQLALDRWGRVHRHRLPEGGELRYVWNDRGRLQAIDWWPSPGRRVSLLSTRPDGYQLANGTRVRSRWHHGRLAWLLHEVQGRPLLAQALEYDAAGRLQRERRRLGHLPLMQRDWQLDAEGRLRRVLTDGEPGDIMEWQADGRRAGSPNAAQSGGLPRQHDGWTLQFGPGRQLMRATQVSQEVRWVRNALGEAIARIRVSPGKVDAVQAEQSLYLRHRKVAHWGERKGTWGVLYRVVYAHEVPVAVIRYRAPAAPERWTPQAPKARVDTVHADALGVPVVVSDAFGRVRWMAAIDSLGRLRHQWGDATRGLALRLPGQWADPDTGWHLNYLRTYDPRRGHYLEPDPMGPHVAGGWPGLSAGVGGSVYGYAGQRPHRWVDPTGLVLFAFDGTLQNADAAANVYRFSQWYRDGQALAAGLAESHYHPGPGGWPLVDLDAAFALSANEIVNTQWQRLLDHLYLLEDAAEPISLDLLGYSRGAALARHFGNQVVEQTRAGRFWFWDAALGDVTACVDLRFMGLFDTVAQFGLLGQGDGAYDFTVDPAWRGVAHAVALNERRDWYPLLSLADRHGQLPPGALELPFVGAHGDIGGGLVHPESVTPPQVPLSDVALQWMADRAEALGVQLERGEAVAQGDWAWVHDLRTPIQRLHGWRRDQADGPIPGVPLSDRAVLAHDGTEWLGAQGDHVHLGRARRQEGEAWIDRLEGWLSSGNERVGQVRLPEYEQAGWHR